VPITLRQAVPTLIALLVICGGEGCETRSDPGSADVRGPEAADADAPAGNDWREIDGSPQVALPADADDEALAAAIARARATAEQARLRWRGTPPEQRRGWAIRWAAPTADGAIEYLWVEPISWSRHRIEGRLANPPQRELACGKDLDELVGFPIAQLADWIGPPGEGATAAAEGESATGEAFTGGFTVRLMRQRHGSTEPPPAADADAP
jgi:uncharacterized protein YegJ (DUF2314 family)